MPHSRTTRDPHQNYSTPEGVVEEEGMVRSWGEAALMEVEEAGGHVLRYLQA